MKSNEPRSLRLNQEHRDDTANAVIKEWIRQNPAPEFPSNVQTLHDLVRKYLPKARIGGNVPKELLGLEHEDLHKFLHTVSTITILPLNSEGEIRSGMAEHVSVLYSEAVEAKLPVAGYKKVSNTHFDEVFLEEKFEETYGVTVEEALESGDLDITVKPKDENGKTYRIYTARVACFVIPRNNTNGNQITLHPTSDEQYYAARREHQKARDAWGKEHTALYNETADMLRQFNTTKQLREAWPDIVPYLPPHLQDPEAVVRVPVPVVTRLNERLGINSEGGNA